MQLVVATYERFLLGFTLVPAEDQSPDYKLQRAFTHAAHQGPVRCLDAAGPWLVSGGQDDQLHIYDTKANKDLGFVMNPGDGALTCVAFHTPPGAARPTHLLSGSDDGSIAIWRAGGDWEALKLLRGHKGPVRSVGLHPSGRLAVSVGHDRLLKLWCLARGRCSYSARLEAEADTVAFSGDGESYALVTDKRISLHSVASEGGLVAQLTHSRRVTAMLVPPPNAPAPAPAAASGGGGAATTNGEQQPPPPPLLLSGCDDGRLCLWDVGCPGAPLWELPGAHQARIRAIVAVTHDPAGGLPTRVATASSDGVVKLWDSSSLGGSSSSSSSSSSGGMELRLLGSVATNGRITGMVLSAPEQAAAAAVAAGPTGAGGQKAKKKKKNKKRKLQEEEPATAEQQQGQQQHQQHIKQVARLDKQQQQQPRAKKPKQDQQQQQQQCKQQHHQKHGRQQQRGGGSDDDDDGGFEVVPAPGGAQQQHAGVRGAAAAAGLPGARASPKQRQRQQQQQQHAAHGASGSQQPGSDAALVPRVQTVMRKKNKQQQGRPGAPAARRGSKHKQHRK